MNTLKFHQFANAWEEGLPIGNGRIAAMVWETPTQNIISLNHEWLWSGDFKERECEEGAHFLPYVRDYLKKGENFKATALAAIAFGGNGGISPLLRRMDSYKPAGEIVISHQPTQSIRRSLELEGGVANCQISTPNNQFSLTAFCHGEKDFFAAQWKAVSPTNITVAFCREEDEGVTCSQTWQPTGFSFDCDGGNGVAFRVVGKWETDGQVTLEKDHISIENLTYFTLFANVGSQHKGIETELQQ